MKQTYHFVCTAPTFPGQVDGCFEFERGLLERSLLAMVFARGKLSGDMVCETCP